MSQGWLKIGADAPKRIVSREDVADVIVDRLSPEEVREVGEALAYEWVSEFLEEQKFIRHQSVVQTELVRRRWGKDIGEDVVASTNPVVPPAVAASPRPKASQRKPRPQLAKMVARDWGTQDGQRVLLGHTMRGLGQHFGVSHSSLYEVPLFVEKILPLRQRGQRGQQANAWRQRSSRDR